MNELLVLIDGNLAAVVMQKRTGDLALSYDSSWQDRTDAYPLSLSMPLTTREHPDESLRPFMEGLLPDNDTLRRRWASRFQISARNPFAMLAHMGEECAGAVQFVRPERMDDVLNGCDGEVEWLSEAGVAARLKDLVEARGTGRLPGDPGQFSLAGAQPKMPLLYEPDRWGIPSGATPTTHILKPPAQEGFDGFDVNEHMCLRLAGELGLAAAESAVQRFENQEALVVRRYDRQRKGGKLVRVHQEDACQALAVPPIRKYENEGGPGAPDIVALILRESDRPGDDVGAFVDALALSWVIGATDAHAKNYSLLIGPGSVRLAPLYDIISVLPYPDRVPERHAKLAMRIDREYHVWKIGRRHWEGLAARCDLDAGPLIDRVAELVAAVPAAIGRAAAAVRAEGVEDEVVDRLEAAIRRHAEACLDVLSAPA